MPNRLADEKSPYLRQHKDNPVDWHPWGEEAFEKARAEDRPVFLSIGYSTCHWCHVMEEESFEDPEVARLMNDTVVAVKVDREERPDLDSIYMTVCQMMRGQGGWPLTVLLTPDRKPFYAATYLPKHGRFGRMGMMELLPRVHKLWNENREKLLEDADDVTATLQEAVAQSAGGSAPEAEHVDEAARQLSSRFDRAHGGFGAAPKFPSPHNLLFLLRQWHRSGNEQLLEKVTATLKGMRQGGIFDQVGYGFHRYSTDARWLLPHFEKMLYDQALHVLAYTEAYRATGREAFRRTAEEVVAYLHRDLEAPDGGFYSAEDADSLTDDGEREEGAFYVWSVDEVREVLDDDLAELVVDAYSMTKEGNYQDESTGRRTGKNVLHLGEPAADVAARHDLAPETLRERLDAARERLYERREERPRPALDDKVLTDWNGLAIAALARLAAATGNEEAERAAVRAARFLEETLRDADGRLLHRYRDGEAAIRAHLEDYAFYVWGLIELYEATFDPEWLALALEHTDRCLDRFWDEDDGGFYQTADDAEALIVRQKELHDGAQPSGNSVQMMNLLRLARMTGRTDLEEKADALAAWAGKQVRAQPSGFTGFLMGVQLALAPGREVVIAGNREAGDTRSLVDALRSAYAPFTVALHRPPGDAPRIAELAPFTAGQTPRDGRAAAYVCQNFSCEAPITDSDALRRRLAGKADDAPPAGR
jgi:hypothetical protein